MKKRRGCLVILLLAGMLSACGTRGREEAAFEVKHFDRTDQIIEEENGKKNDFASIEKYLKVGDTEILLGRGTGYSGSGVSHTERNRSFGRPVFSVCPQGKRRLGTGGIYE